jgi:ribosomal protein S18 acetylase RimI-like enzyme
MEIIHSHSKDEIESFFRQNKFLHNYSIGDLDDFFWHHTEWFALMEQGQIEQIALLYDMDELPVLLALTDVNLNSMRYFLSSIAHLLPRRFYAHLTPSLNNVFDNYFSGASHGLHCKMGLMDARKLDKVDSSAVIQLSSADLPELMKLYEESYPGNWFSPKMLATGFYYGMREGGKLASVAGVHVYSEEFKVAALGNITTHPDFRGKGLAKIATAELCKSLLQKVDFIGLNVKSDNASAIKCYKNLGFEHVADYEEWMFEEK